MFSLALKFGGMVKLSGQPATAGYKTYLTECLFCIRPNVSLFLSSLWPVILFS